MTLKLELVDGTTHTFETPAGTATFQAAIDKAIQQHGFMNAKQFFPLHNVKLATLQG